MTALQEFKKIVGIAEPDDTEVKGKVETAEKANSSQAKPDDKNEAEDKPFTVVKGKVEEVKDKVKEKISKTNSETKEEPNTAKNTKAAEDDTDDNSIIEEISKAEETEVVRKDKEDQEMENRNMRSMEFYSRVGNAIYDVDRGLEMDSQLRSWIIEQFSRDADLKKEVLRTLPSIIEKNPKIIPSIKEMIKDAAEANVPYIVTYLSKIDDKEYEDRAEAEAAGAEMAKRLGLDPSKTIKLVYHKLKADGSIGSKVSRDEVEDYVQTFDGDKARLRKELHLPNPSKKGKKDDPRATEAANDKPAGDDGDKPAAKAGAE